MKPVIAGLNVLETDKLSIGWTTPDDVIVITLPQFFFIMLGIRLFVILMVFKSIDLTKRSNTLLSVSIGLDGGGPPFQDLKRVYVWKD